MSNECEEWTKRALDAERERDWANEQVDDIRAVLVSERAEADNAALRLRLDVVRLEMESEGWDDEPPESSRGRAVAACYFPASAPIPGAALLAEVEALREAWGVTRCIFEDIAKSGTLADAPITDREHAARILAAVDALKGKP